MKINKLYCISLIIFLLASLRISNEISNGWLGPNADVNITFPKDSIYLFDYNLRKDDIILFDDNTYNVIKNFNNKKMPITYFKLYLDKIPEISKNNLRGKRGLAFVNCIFIDEFQSQNKFLLVNKISSMQVNNMNFCISSISEGN